MFFRALVLGALLTLGGAPVPAQSNATERLIQGIIHDVVERAIEVARNEVKRSTGINAVRRGFDHRKRYRSAPPYLPFATRHELKKLPAEHDRKIARLEAEFVREARKAEREFRRETAKEDKPYMVRHWRPKLRRMMDKAYRKFAEKMAEENDRFDEKRAEIINSYVTERLIQDTIHDVVEPAIERARKEIRRSAGVDAVRRGFDYNKSYRPAPPYIPSATRHELRKLTAEHDGTIARAEAEFAGKVREAERKFRQEAAKEDELYKLREKRRKLRSKMEKAYRKFEEKMAEENNRFDEKREEIISKRCG